MPPMEPLVATHLHPKHMAAANPTLPSKVDSFQSSMMEHGSKAVALCQGSECDLYADRVPIEIAGQSVNHASSDTRGRELCRYRSFSASSEMRGSSRRQGHGRNVHSRERTRTWQISLTGEKEAILDAPVVAEGIFGLVLTLMQKICEEKKRDEALQFCMPRKAQTAPHPPPRQTAPPPPPLHKLWPVHPPATTFLD